MNHKSIENYLKFQSKKADKMLASLYFTFFAQILFKRNLANENTALLIWYSRYKLYKRKRPARAGLKL